MAVLAHYSVGNDRPCANERGATTVCVSTLRKRERRDYSVRVDHAQRERRNYSMRVDRPNRREATTYSMPCRPCAQERGATTVCVSTARKGGGRYSMRGDQRHRRLG